VIGVLDAVRLFTAAWLIDRVSDADDVTVGDPGVSVAVSQLGSVAGLSVSGIVPFPTLTAMTCGLGAVTELICAVKFAVADGATVMTGTTGGPETTRLTGIVWFTTAAPGAFTRTLPV
jgi:hypothetical protein